MAHAPDRWQPIEGIKQQRQGFDLLREALAYFDGGGVIGAGAWLPVLGNWELGECFTAYDYLDRYDDVKA